MNNELYHYGVLGMRWGHRKAMRSEIRTARQNRKVRDANIQKQYDRAEKNIEKGYRRGQNLSSRDQSRMQRADTKATNAWAKSKAQYKSEKAAAKAKYKNAVKNTENNGKILENVKNYRAKRNAKIDSSMNHFTPAGGYALATGASRLNRQQKKIVKANVAKYINGVANAYISTSNASYYKKKGVDYARKAAITGLSLSTLKDSADYYGDVVYATKQLYKKSKRK